MGSFKDDVRREVGASIDTLARRHSSTSDEQEKGTIADVMSALQRESSVQTQPSMLEAANSVATATVELERAVAAARLAPFDGYLAALEEHFARLNQLSGKLHARESLPRAVARRAQGRKPRRSNRRGARGVETRAQAVVNSTKFAALREEYQRNFDACRVRPEYQPNVGYYVNRLRQGRANYELIQAEVRVPWSFVGVVHAMECGFNFYGHLHNGDPLTARTVHVPKGRPARATPPFTWLQSALDALRLRNLDAVKDWSVPHMLYLLEGYNGFGYRSRGVPTPYLWSFSSLYEKGKFTHDGKFDPNAVSRQCGAVLMLKAVLSG